MNFIWSKNGKAIARQFSTIDKSVIYYSYCVMLDKWIVLKSPLTLAEALLLLVAKGYISAIESANIKKTEIEFLKNLDKK